MKAPLFMTMLLSFLSLASAKYTVLDTYYDRIEGATVQRVILRPEGNCLVLLSDGTNSKWVYFSSTDPNTGKQRLAMVIAAKSNISTINAFLKKNVNGSVPTIDIPYEGNTNIYLDYFEISN